MSAADGMGDKDKDKNKDKNKDSNDPDLIDGHLAQLRAHLLVAPGRAAEIVAEAEDHLREATAVGVATGFQEADAQRAAIAAFGPAKKMARAHRRSARETLAALAMAVWPLIGLFALVSAVIGGALDYRLGGVSVLVVPVSDGNGALVGHPQLVTGHLQVMPVGLVGVVAPLIGSAIVGAVLVAGYLVARRRWASRVAAVPLHALFPFAAAVVLAAVALAAFRAAITGTLWGYLSYAPGLYEFQVGVLIAAGLMAAGCALWGVARLAAMTFGWFRSRGDEATPANAVAS